MSVTDRLLITLLSGMILWGIKELSSHLIKKNRVKAAILCEISFLVSSAKDTKKFLNESFCNTLEVGKNVQYSVDFTLEEAEIYKVHAPTLTSYLSNSELKRTIKFYRAFKEFEVLCSGFFRDLSEWQKSEKKLTKDDLQYVERKKARIISIASIISENEVTSIKNLPNDYKGQLTPGTIVR